MFEFTHDLVINDNTGNIKIGGNKVRFAAVEWGMNLQNLLEWIPATATSTNRQILMIDPTLNIEVKDIARFSVRRAAPAVNEVLTLDETGITVPATKAEGDVVRMVITLGLEGRVISTYNDQYPDHTRDLFTESNIVDNQGNLEIDWAKLAKGIQDQQADGSFKFATVEHDAGTDNLIITAPDEYTRIVKVRLVLVKNTNNVGGILTGYQDYTPLFEVERKDWVNLPNPLPTGVAAATVGTLGVGNAKQLIHNNRLLTAANIDPFGLHKEERPVPGAKYDMYVIELLTDRKHIGHQVVGAFDLSLTKVVLYIKNDGTSASPAAAFETELGLINPANAKKLETPGTAIGVTGLQTKVELYNK